MLGEAKKIQINLQNFSAGHKAIRKELEIAKQINSGMKIKMRRDAAQRAGCFWERQLVSQFLKVHASWKLRSLARSVELFQHFINCQGGGRPGLDIKYLLCIVDHGNVLVVKN